MRVLVVEDDPVTSLQIVETLVRDGHDATAASTGEEAWDAYVAAPFPLVLLDWELPDVDGLEVCRRIRSHRTPVEPHILFVTARDGGDDVIDALGAGADDYCSKPVSADDLRLRVRIAASHLARQAASLEELSSFEDIIESSSELIQTVRGDGSVAFANPAWLKAMGYDRSELDAISMFDLVVPAKRRRFELQFRRALDGRASGLIETALTTRAGTQIVIEGVMRPRYRGRRPTSVRCLFHDVSRRKRAEEALHAILEGTARTTGRDFFRSLTRHIANALRARCSVVGELTEGESPRLRALASWDGTQFQEVEEIEIGPLAELQAEQAFDASQLDESSAVRIFMDRFDARCCLVAPLVGSGGKSLGLLCVLDDESMSYGSADLRVLRTFAERASTELERMHAQAALERRESLMASLATIERDLLAWRGEWSDLALVLRELGLAADVSRTYVFENHFAVDGALLTGQRAEWCSRGISEQIENEALQAIPFMDFAPDWCTALGQRRLVAASVRDLPDPLRAELISEDIKSIMLAPLFAGDRFVGFIGVDECRMDRRWGQAEKDLIKSTAGALSLALERREAQERLDGILTSLQEVVWSISAHDMSRVYVNPAVERVFGYAVEEFYSRKNLWTDVVHPEDQEIVERFTRDILNGSECAVEYRIIRPDGTVRWLRDRGKLTCDHHGVPMRLDGLATDITEHKEARISADAFSALAKRLSSVRTAEGAASVVFVVADELIGWDSCWMDLYDQADGQLRPVLYLDLVDGERMEVTPPDRERVHSPIAESVIADGPRIVHRGMTEDAPELAPFGDENRLSESLLFVPIRSGKQTVGVLSVQSYTPSRYTPRDLKTLQALADHCGGALKRAKAQEELRRSERRNRAMLDAIPDLLFRIDRDGRYLSVYAHDEGQLVAPPNEIVGRTIEELMPPPIAAETLERIAVALDTRVTQAFECDLELDGTLQNFEARISMCGSDEVICVVRNVTATKRAIERRLTLERRMQETQKLESLGVLAGGIAHDFNNLLTSIMGYASLAQMKLGRDSPVASYMRDIEESTQSAAELAMLMLAYSGKGQFIIQPLDLREVLFSTEGLLHTELLKLRSIVEYDVPEQLSAIEGDGTQLRQVVMNLVLNAAQSMSEEGGRVRIRVRDVPTRPADARIGFSTEEDTGSYVCLEVSDSGCGMDSDTVDRIFDPFFTTKVRGRGLGLSAVVGIVRGHKATLNVASKPGEGTTFQIHFPASDQPVAATRDRDAPAEARGAGLVLVVDDEPNVRRLAREVLETNGYSVLTARDGVHALEVFEQNVADVTLVLLDMTMPNMNGVEAFRAMQTIRPSVPVLVSSGYSEQEAINRFEGEAPLGFIQKPYRAGELLLKIEEIGTRANPGASIEA